LKIKTNTMFKWYRLLKGGTWYLNELHFIGIRIPMWSRRKRYDKYSNSLTIKKEKYI